MRHRNAGKKLNRTSEHRRALFMNMANALIKHEQIITTVAKAKALKPVAEKLITLGKKGGLANRRRAYGKLRDDAVVEKLFSTLAERYAKRGGGCVRVLKAGYRESDNAPLAIIELVDRDEEARGRDSGPTQAKEEEAGAKEKGKGKEKEKSGKKEEKAKTPKEKKEQKAAA